MKRLLIIAALLVAALSSAAQVERPKLVVGIVVDQMRWDYLYYYSEDYGEGGIKRLLSEGYSCENTMINYVPTVTAIGHTSLYTGSVPFFHGIAGNGFMIDGKPVSSTDDDSVVGVGTDSNAGKNSPRNLRATTIGDELKQALDFECKVMVWPSSPVRQSCQQGIAPMPPTGGIARLDTSSPALTIWTACLVGWRNLTVNITPSLSLTSILAMRA